MKAKPVDTDADDKRVATELKQRIAQLCALIAKADRRGISCDFQIRKNEKSVWAVTQCEVRKRF